MKHIMVAGLFLFSSVAMGSSMGGGSSLSTSSALPIMLAQAGHSHAMHGHMESAKPLPISKTLTVSNCWIRSLPEPAPSAGYFVVKNAGDQPVKLVGASSATYGMVMLHQTTHQDGMSKMAMTHDVAIPAGSQLEFKPGSYHAMLEKPAQQPELGSFVVMDFQFDSGEKATANCEIKAPGTLSH